MAAGGDRLSELPDDLHRRILHFAPLKEAASTTVLSRRWCAPLWLSSGAMNLEMDVDRARFFSSAEAALDAAHVPVTRLTMHVQSTGNSRNSSLVNTVLSHRTARRVEELRLVAKNRGYDYLFHDPQGSYTVTLDYLPLETLRVLELTGCNVVLCQRKAAALVLPRLSSLRLSSCSQHLSSLQRFIDAAPALAAVRLEHVLIDATENDNAHLPSSPSACRLGCPTATVLVLDSCTWKEKNQCPDRSGHYIITVHVDGLEINAPRLRRFRYKGPLRSFSLNPRPLELEQADLDFSERRNNYNTENKDPDRDLAAFWCFTRDFTGTKEMILIVSHLDSIAIVSEARRAELLPTFRRLQRLEVQGGAHSTKGRSATLAILNLLRCCPALTALRINLIVENRHNASNKEGVPETRKPQKEAQVAALMGARHHFQCLRSSLKCVALQFRLEKADCLGVKLIKFFAEDAMGLEKMHIDGGDEKLGEHMNPKIKKWNSKRKRLGATSFVVLPLKR